MAWSWGRKRYILSVVVMSEIETKYIKAKQHYNNISFIVLKIKQTTQSHKGTHHALTFMSTTQ